MPDRYYICVEEYRMHGMRNVSILDDHAEV